MMFNLKDMTLCIQQYPYIVIILLYNIKRETSAEKPPFGVQK